MSQKGEKYARRMERRVDKLEQDVAAITTEQTTQGVRISAVEDDLAVYRAAVSARELKQAAAEVKAAKERRTARAAERERKARRRNKVLAFIALAVAQTESNFDMDAVGASGEVGIMQLNPGPGSSYHAEIQAATGLDPTTASGNIAGGCYKLGLYLAKYGSVEKAAMAYNMGEGGARSAWDSGITSTDYSKAVKEAMETWECTVNAWGGV